MNVFQFDRLNDIANMTLFAIPDYQRDYSWGAGEVKTLIEDIRHLIEENGSLGQKTHFCGSIVVIDLDPNLSKNTYQTLLNPKLKNYAKVNVIDGQQRLSTLSLLLIAIKNQVKDTDYSLAKYIDLIDTEIKDEANRFIPVLHFADLNTQNCYRKLLYGEDIAYDTNRSGAKNMQRAYDICTQFVGEICEKSGNVEQALDRIIDQVRYQLTFVGISCKEESDAFQIFESLNATGLSLTPAEQVKNLIMMESRDSTSHALSQWDNITSTVGEETLVAFLSHFLFCEKGQRVPRKNTYSEFKGLLRKKSVGTVLNHLVASASIYGELRHPSASNISASILQDFRDLGVDQCYAPLLAAGERFGVRSKSFMAIADAALVYIARHNVCSQSSNKLDAVFGDACKKIYDASNDENSIVCFFKSNQIDTETFQKSFEGLSFEYSAKPQRIARVLLRRIEEYSHGSNHPLQFKRDELTVEHIIPKHPEQEDLESWLGVEVDSDTMDRFVDQVIKSVGNLALLFQTENTTAGNESYLEKVRIYSSQTKDINGHDRGIPKETFALISDLLTCYPTQFDEAAVRDRSARLAKLAAEAWQ